MTNGADRLFDLSSGILAAILVMLLSSGLVDPGEPAHWVGLAAIWILAHAALKPQAFRRRFVPGASPLALAGIRIWACSALLVCVLRSDLASTARLPRELLAVSPGRIDLMFRIPGFLGFLESEACLSAFRALTILFLAAGAAGFLTRVAIPLATVCSVFYVAIFVDYTYFFHQWLIGTYVVAAVAVTPCGDALSLDAWLRHRAGKPPVQRPAAVYAWSRYLCWTALALPYFYAGLSKLRNGGWMWWDPLNLRGKVVRDTLQKGVFEPPWGLEFFTAPDALFGAIGILTLIFEVGFILVLFSPHARRILPLGAAAMHLGILVLQNFIFVDALLMQAIFFDWRRLGERVRSQIGSIAPALPEAPTPAASRAYGSRASYAALVIGLVWLLRIEAYPLSSWGMYSGTRLESSIAYHVTWAQHATLGRIPAPYERCFPAPAFNPYIRMAAYAFGGPAEQDASRKFFSACAMELNRGKPAAERISAFRVEQWQWDWNADPPGPPYGALLDAKVWPVASREGARQPLLD